MSSPCDGFRLAYERHGPRGASVLLLHGWPGDHTDFRYVVPLLAGDFDVVVPDLRGFGRSDKHSVDPSLGYTAAAQADSIVALIDELGLHRPIIGGYDVGSRVAQALANRHPGLAEHLVLSPPLPGVGGRVLSPNAQREFWYQPFHQLSLSDELIDGDRDAIQKYLRHFWDHWSDPTFTAADEDFNHLVNLYSPPGAFAASIAWYRASGGTVATASAEQPPDPKHRIGTPTSVLWGDHDPLYPREWSDRLDEFFADVSIIPVDGTGHFTPIERPAEFAALIRDACATP